jgi:hypothetical protein
VAKVTTYKDYEVCNSQRLGETNSGLRFIAGRA